MALLLMSAACGANVATPFEAASGSGGFSGDAGPGCVAPAASASAGSVYACGATLAACADDCCEAPCNGGTCGAAPETWLSLEPTDVSSINVAGPYLFIYRDDAGVLRVPLDDPTGAEALSWRLGHVSDEMQTYSALQLAPDTTRIEVWSLGGPADALPSELAILTKDEGHLAYPIAEAGGALFVIERHPDDVDAPRIHQLSKSTGALELTTELDPGDEVRGVFVVGEHVFAIRHGGVSGHKELVRLEGGVAVVVSKSAGPSPVSLNYVIGDRVYWQLNEELWSATIDAAGEVSDTALVCCAPSLGDAVLRSRAGTVFYSAAEVVAEDGSSTMTIGRLDVTDCTYRVLGDRVPSYPSGLVGLTGSAEAAFWVRPSSEGGPLRIMRAF